VDECDGRVNAQAGDAASHPVTSSTAAAAGGGDHYVVSSHRELSSPDNKTVSWTSADVMSWLEQSRLQHLRDWYVDACVC